MGRYRSFTIRIVTKDPEFQLEVADVDDKKMAIMTDLAHPIAENVFAQEGFGLVSTFSDADLAAVSAQLKARLIARRVS